MSRTTEAACIGVGLVNKIGNPARTARQHLRLALKWIFIYALHYTGVLAFVRWWIRRNGAVVLTFHRVLSEAAAAATSSPAGLIVKQATFESLLRHIKPRYSMFDLGNGGPTGEAQQIQVAVTFDDGWEDNASTAFPIAAKLKVPLTIFVCPELMDTPAPFWPERIVVLMRHAQASPEAMKCLHEVLASTGNPNLATAVEGGNGDCTRNLIEYLKSVPGRERERLLDCLWSREEFSEALPDAAVDRTMSWSQLAQLHAAGVRFGSHTQRHEILTRVPLAQVEHEVGDSKAALQRHVSHCPMMSYPNGDFSREVRDVVARCGFEMAFINSPGVWRRSGDRFLIPRLNLCEDKLIGMDGRFSPLAFEYNVFWRAFRHRRQGHPT